jgi:hypothetical protein
VIVKGRTRPRIAQQVECQGFAKEETKQSEQASDEDDSSLAWLKLASHILVLVDLRFLLVHTL